MSLSYARKTPREIRNAFSAEWLDISDYFFRPILVRPIFCRSTLIIQTFILRTRHYFPVDCCLEHFPRKISSFNFHNGKHLLSRLVPDDELRDFLLQNGCFRVWDSVRKVNPKDSNLCHCCEEWTPFIFNGTKFHFALPRWNVINYPSPRANF